jgi:hypothetical protein
VSLENGKKIRMNSSYSKDLPTALCIFIYSAFPLKWKAFHLKGKIERFIQVAREVFKQFTALYPDATLADLTEYAHSWCMDVYGVKKHGTTGIPPRIAFEQDEKPHLNPLPCEPFVPAR